MKKALVVGIDDYDSPNELHGCVNDAVEVSALLEANGDGSPNFDVLRLTSNDHNISSEKLHDALIDLFSGKAETAVFYFAGHGIIDEATNSGFLVTQDGTKPNWGIGLASVLDLANKAYPEIGSSVIILDSCQSGFAGEVQGLGKGVSPSVIGNGVTILTACHRNGTAAEVKGHGTFTSILLDGLSGASADILGRVTPASLYAHVDQTLGAWKQRPIYKANVQNFIDLRQVAPKVALNVLRRLPEYFPSPSHVFKLDPSFEPDRGEEAANLKDVEVVPEHVRKYRELQSCFQNGLVLPVDQPFMWHAAVNSTGCRLTATGAHYRRLAELKQI